MPITDRPGVTGMVCASCGTEVPISAGALVCPVSSPADRRHVLHFVDSVAPFRPVDHPNPFLAYRAYLAVDAHGAAIGLDDARREGIIEGLDAAVARVAGTGFRRTPLARQDRLSDALGFAPEGGIWVKDETQNVGGSHKARHLFTEMVQLLMSEAAGTARWGDGPRPRLAIASCGNAAIAASTIAAAVGWPIDVFVPPSASKSVLDVLGSLRASVTVCPRREADPAGDPCVIRFREAVAAGSVPFGVQGTENAWCLDGGRTIGWEIADAEERMSTLPLDRLFIQVGGGAFAANAATGLFAGGLRPMLHAVQTQGCAPLARAWDRAKASGGTRNAGARWDECMWPWEGEMSSLADGILDDETYDWVAVCNAMSDSGGSPVVASERDVVEAYALAHRTTDIDVSPTGSAGLAGVLAMRDSIADDERIVVVFSGVRRHFMALPNV